MEPDESERLIDGRLRRLPRLRAPVTLLPRVMSAVHQVSTRPWYARAWFTWPVGARAAVLLVLTAGAVALTLVTPILFSPFTPLVERASAGVAAPVFSATARIEVVTTVIGVVWRALVAPIVPYALGLVVFMYVTCALVGSALSYLVFGKATGR